MEYSLSLAASSSLQLQSSKVSLSRGQSGCQTSQLTLSTRKLANSVGSHSISFTQWWAMAGRSPVDPPTLQHVCLVVPFWTLVLSLHTFNFSTRPPYSPYHLLLYCWGGCWLLRQTSWLWPAVKSKVALPVVLRPWALYTLTSGFQSFQKTSWTLTMCALLLLSLEESELFLEFQWGKARQMTTSGFVPLAFLWLRELMESILPFAKENRALGLLTHGTRLSRSSGCRFHSFTAFKLKGSLP